MELSTYIESLRADLVRAAEAGGETAREAAERLALALEPATRMALMEALSDATAQITQELDGAVVEVRLRGRDPQFVVSHAQPDDVTQRIETAEEPADEGDATARITVRLSEGLKTRAEEAAAGLGQSLNTWIVGAIRAATREPGITVEVDLPGFGSVRSSGPPRPGRRVQGWAR